MGYSFDYLVGHLQCPQCGATSAADGSTNMQTYLRAEPQLAWLGAGDGLDVDPSNVRESGYLMVREPSPDEPTRILQTWECPSCGAPANWAEIVVREGAIERVTAVSLTREVFERSHFIAPEADSVAAELAGRAVQEVAAESVVPLLHAYL